VPDSFDAASASVEEQRRALLAAVAAGGTQGRQAYQQAQAEVGALRQNAIRAALAEAGQRGAPQAVQDQISAQVGQGYDRQLSGMAASQGSRDAEYAQRGAAGNSYMDQVQGAIPVLRAQAQQQKEELQAKAMADAEERALKLDLGKMQLMKAMQGGSDTENPIALAKLQMAQEEHDWKGQERQAAIDGPKIDDWRKGVYDRVTKMGQPKIQREFEFATSENPMGEGLDAALAHVRNLRNEAASGGRHVFKKDGSYGVLENLLREFYSRG